MRRFIMSKTQEFTTNLNCGKCVAAVAPYLDAHPLVEDWSVNTDVAQKTLTVSGTADEKTIRSVVSEAGFQVLGGTEEVPSETPKLVTYRPLLLIVGYLLCAVLLSEFTAEKFLPMRAMRHFMAGFFFVFSFFKMLDVTAFANSFQGYDLLAARFRAYALAYPFIEVLLGICYLVNWNPTVTNIATAAIMLLGIVGVTRVLLQKKTIQCACLGTVFNLPMSYVTFIENGLMIVMACAMLLTG